MKTNNFMPKEKSATDKLKDIAKSILPKSLGGKGSLKDKVEKARDSMILRDNKK